MRSGELVTLLGDALTRTEVRWRIDNVRLVRKRRPRWTGFVAIRVVVVPAHVLWDINDDHGVGRTLDSGTVKRGVILAWWIARGWSP